VHNGNRLPENSGSGPRAIARMGGISYARTTDLFDLTCPDR